MREIRLRWLRHVLRREKTNAVTVTKNMSVDGKRGRGIPKKRWFEVIKCDMRMTGVVVFVRRMLRSLVNGN